jgi:hypothetical protein
MSRRMVAAAVLLLSVWTSVSFAQSFNARRTGMGGVLLPGGGLGGESDNVAYRAVPRSNAQSIDIPLPIGLIPLMQDPPALKSSDPDFNVYDLANKLYNPPWNLQLIEPRTSSSDVVVSLGRNYLAVDLGEIANLFPDDRSRFGSVGHLPAVGLGFRSLFANVSAATYVENDLSMNDALLGALKYGEAFRPNTDYSLRDDVQGQAAMALQLGWAAAVAGRSPAPAGGVDMGDRSGIYFGARARLLRGLAYGDARNLVGFATSDTLFSSNPVALDYVGYARTAMPSGGGWGQGFDLGAVWVTGDLELGVGANDLGSEIQWRVEESIVRRDSVSGDLKRTVTAKDVALTSKLPPSYSLTAARRFGGTLVAADVVRGVYDVTYHVGAERWHGPVALRAGTSLDAEQQVQFAGGLGFKLGRFGVDTGVATNSRNLSHDRGLELCLGLALYH